MTPRSWHRPGSGILVILVAIGLLILTLATGKFTVLVGKLYSPYTAFIAVIMIVEYIILKGADRTALYRRELEAARAIRREDLLAFRQMESRLEDLKAEMDRTTGDEDSIELVGKVKKQITDLLERLRTRI